MKRGALIASVATVASVIATGSAWAQDDGIPVDGAIDFQRPATTVMTDIVAFHNFVLPIIVAISILVLVLLLWVIVRYNRAANPTPRKFTHNMLVEVIWTIVPVLILVVIAWKSFPLIYKEEQIPPQAQLQLKVTGNSWFWTYEYPQLGVNVTSQLLPEEDARAQGRPWLLATTAPLYVPVGEPVHVIITSNDVIHAFAVPAFGVKEDAIQGRVNDTWFQVDRPGVFYGQCSELCGQNHAFMPIEVRAVPRAEFDAWVAQQGGTVAAADATAPEGDATTPPAGGQQPTPAPQPSPTR
ncbi:cytochrome c oxidase subunit II [Terricaulis sp.]|uniref:cytochrome c oxidase subunit II n=1 Tax=Terricaulis sp. TaxID=2768686 RepID=UPI003783662C